MKAATRVPVRCDADARHNLSADAIACATRCQQQRADGFRAAFEYNSREVIRIANDLIAAGGAL